MGPSGSDKTTILNLLNALDQPTSGTVVVLDNDLSNLNPDEAATFRREHIGLVFQQFHLVSYLMALENVMLAQYHHSITDQAEAMRALETVQLAERVHHLPSQLSGGEQQRVCIARALIYDLQIVLADEPTGNLDKQNADTILGIFLRLHQQGKTLVAASHNVALARHVQRTIVFRHGQIADDATGSVSLRTARVDVTADRELFRFNPGLFPTHVSWSPDGSQLTFDLGQQLLVDGSPAFGTAGQTVATYLINNDGSKLRRLLDAPSGFPAWSPWFQMAGDLNADGAVDAFDLAIILNAWSMNVPLADPTGNGRVNAFDLAVVLDHWGASNRSRTAVLPEPGPLLMIGLAMSWLLARWRHSRI